MTTPETMDELLGTTQRIRTESVIPTTKTTLTASMPSATRAEMRQGLLRVALIANGISQIPIGGEGIRLTKQTDVYFSEYDPDSSFNGLTQIIYNQAQRRR